jgi:hypothetical protein
VHLELCHAYNGYEKAQECDFFSVVSQVWAQTFHWNPTEKIGNYNMIEVKTYLSLIPSTSQSHSSKVPPEQHVT